MRSFQQRRQTECACSELYNCCWSGHYSAGRRIDAFFPRGARRVNLRVSPTAIRTPQDLPMSIASRLLIVSFLAAAPLAGQQTDPTPDAVDAIFSHVSGDAGPGCALGVSRGGEIFLQRAYGMAELEHGVPNVPATIFEAGSVSKQLVVAAVVLLAQDGKISLNDDVRRYLPELPDYEATITVRHLIHHTSGLRDWGVVAGLGGWPRGSRVHTQAHALDIASRQTALNFRPGEHYSYTNTGYNLLAILVDRVSGTSFAEFSRARIFEPLGMSRTSWRDDHTRVVPGRATAYQPVPDGRFRLDMPFENVHGQGGLLTTVEDLLRWTRALETGELGGPDFIAEMHRQGVLNSGETISYAGGLFATHHHGLPEISHSGATAGYRAFLARYPEQGIAVAVLCNAAHAGAPVMGRQVAELYLGVALPAAAAPPPPAERPVIASTGADTPGGEPVREFAPTPAELAPYAGEYWSDEAEGGVTIAVEGRTLVLRRRFGGAIPLAPAYTDTFTSALGTIRFHRDSTGRIVELSTGSERVWDLRFQRHR
jgi:CubicO group peptidase (beta-lactamase class C family)